MEVSQQLLDNLQRIRKTYYPEIEKNYQEEYDPEDPWIDGKWIFVDGKKTRWTRFLPKRI
jgi:hypothetical protein